MIKDKCQTKSIFKAKISVICLLIIQGPLQSALPACKCLIYNCQQSLRLSSGREAKLPRPSSSQILFCKLNGSNRPTGGGKIFPAEGCRGKASFMICLKKRKRGSQQVAGFVKGQQSSVGRLCFVRVASVDVTNVSEECSPSERR